MVFVYLLLSSLIKPEWRTIPTVTLLLLQHMHCGNSSVKLLRRRTEVNISVCCCNNLSRFEIFNKSYFGKLGHEVTISIFLLYMSMRLVYQSHYIALY